MSVTFKEIIMQLTEAQEQAMLELGGSAEGHGFIPQRVLDELLGCELIHWRSEGEVDFTPRGQEVYEMLAASAGKNLGPIENPRPHPQLH